MSESKQANEYQLKDVRIVNLPPSKVVSIQYYCEEPEYRAKEEMDKFVRESGLLKTKPDLRYYGFNNPNCSADTKEGMPDHGYEIWVTIPRNFAVPEYYKIKEFPGGLYAAHMIKMGNFHEWDWLVQWVENSDKYAANLGDPASMGGMLEEYLNYYNSVQDINLNEEDVQLDLLIPIIKKVQG